MISVNSAWNLINFRSGLIQALVANDYEVIAVAPPDKYASKLSDLGCRHIPIIIDNKGTNPFNDLLLLIRYVRLFRTEKPDVFLSYTVKPNVYGSIAASILLIPVINNIAGLGSVFNTHGLLNKFVKFLYKIALSSSKHVFFQNDDDRKLFISSKLVSKSVTDIIPGSGVNLLKFLKTPLPNNTKVRFLLIARMLWDKGIGEYVEAARLLNHRGIDAEYCLLGFLDVQNPDAISKKSMKEMISEDNVRYLGISDNVQEEIAKADCIVLPSFYPEGTPKALLEGAAMARPIITTNTPGCKDVVDDGYNGFLCNPRDVYDLAEKMEHIVLMSHAERMKMGLLSRHKAETKFDENFVIQSYLNAIEALT